MIFRKKEEIREPFTVEQCQSCHKENKRKYQKGDLLFSKTSNCSSCDNQMLITKIFGEKITEQ